MYYLFHTCTGYIRIASVLWVLHITELRLLQDQSVIVLGLPDMIVIGGSLDFYCDAVFRDYSVALFPTYSQLFFNNECG